MPLYPIFAKTNRRTFLATASLLSAGCGASKASRTEQKAPDSELETLPNSRAEFDKLNPEARLGKYVAGDVAPDFTLKVRHSQSSVTLSSYRNKMPAALVFGSYS